MREEENTYIDRSHWISLKAVESYAEKAVATGRKIWNGKSILSGAYDKLPVEWLADDKKIITESQKAAGINFHIICNCAEGRISIYGVTDSLEMASVSPTLKKVAIEAQLNPRDKHLIRRIIVYPVYPQDYREFERIAGRVKEAFDELENAMKKDNLNKSLDRLHENAKMLNRSRAQSAPKIYHPLSAN